MFQTQIDAILPFFVSDHLAENLAIVSRPFGQLAVNMAGELPANGETVEVLRHLLVAKDAAVRSATLIPATTGV